jgi:hypothetical protein
MRGFRCRGVAILGHLIETDWARRSRATFLAALLLLSGFVASSSAVSGLAGAAADSHDTPLIVTRESYTKATETYIADSFCPPDLTVHSLGTMFDGEPGGIIGADYLQARALESGNLLWTLQDARIRTPTGARYVHTIGMLQVDRCFSVLVGGSS